MKKYSFQACSAALLAGAFLLPFAASAGLADLEALQTANANLLMQYGFEGGSDATRLADGSANGYALQRTQGLDNGGSVYDIQFVPGFDGASQAYQPYYDVSNYRIGAGLNTISTSIPVGNTLTVEAVVQLDPFVLPTGASGAYIIDARPQPSNGRAYLYRQLNTPTSRVTTTLGDTFADAPEVPGYDYTAGHWYYLAFTASYDSGANQSTVTWYSANLTLGDPVMALRATDSTTFQGDWTGTGQFGIGNFLNGSQEYLEGRIDNVAVTSQILDQSDLQQRLNALYVPVPEPSTFALVAIGGLAFFVRKIRR